jgi:hypothetical protein
LPLERAAGLATLFFVLAALTAAPFFLFLPGRGELVRLAIVSLL